VALRSEGGSVRTIRRRGARGGQVPHVPPHPTLAGAAPSLFHANFRLPSAITRHGAWYQGTKTGQTSAYRLKERLLGGYCKAFQALAAMPRGRRARGISRRIHAMRCGLDRDNHAQSASSSDAHLPGGLCREVDRADSALHQPANRALGVRRAERRGPSPRLSGG
jgi:hypothetical protein